MTSSIKPSEDKAEICTQLTSKKGSVQNIRAGKTQLKASKYKRDEKQ